MDRAYRGYLIRQNALNGCIWIEKDGAHIAYAASAQDAEDQVRALVGDPDPVVRLADPMEPFTWEWEGRLSDFLRDNAESIDADEGARIRAAVLAGETYSGGGGAEAEWEVWPLTTGASKEGGAR